MAAKGSKKDGKKRGKARKKPKLPRRTWPRSPVQQPHSTTKGKKGYDRAEDRKREREEAEGA
jgi:hypothetical protein